MNKILRFTFVALLTLVCTGINAQDKVLPYEESFREGQGDFSIDNKVLPKGLNYVWKHYVDKNKQENSCMKASAYLFKTKTRFAAESWLVSPIIDISAAKAPVLSFEHTGNFFGKPTEDATLMVKAEGGDWEKVDIPTYFANNNWVYVNATIPLAKYAGKKIRFAFKYVSTDQYAGTWEIKNLSVKESTSTFIGEVKENNLMEGSRYNLSGQRVGKDYKGVVIENGRKVLKK